MSACFKSSGNKTPASLFRPVSPVLITSDCNSDILAISDFNNISSVFYKDMLSFANNKHFRLPVSKGIYTLL
jgi:hypothetical protein